MGGCDQHKTGDLVEANFYIEAPNGYKYRATVLGKIVKRYERHIGIGQHHCYQILFDAPRWPDSKDLLVDMMENDLRFL